MAKFYMLYDGVIVKNVVKHRRVHATIKDGEREIVKDNLEQLNRPFVEEEFAQAFEFFDTLTFTMAGVKWNFKME